LVKAALGSGGQWSGSGWGSGQNRRRPVCCGMLTIDPLPFDADDLRASPVDRSLAIRSAPGRPLGKEERAFNRALAKLQALSRALDEEKRRLDRLLVFHAAEIRPRTEQVTVLRAALVRALAPFLDHRRLTKAQHRVLQQILVVQLDEVLAHIEKPDPDLQAIFERLHGISFTQAVQDNIQEARAGMAAILDELGLDVNVPELRADMTEAEAAAAAAQLADELRRAGESRAADESQSRRGKRQVAQAERAQRHEQLRKDSLGAVYRREKKSRVMQNITSAYAGGDLHALLQLELEWLGGSSGDAARLGVDKLRAYTELLKQQATELADEVQSLQLHPRYAPLLVEGPFGFPLVIDGRREQERLDTTIAQVRTALERLSSRDALDEIRDTIREYRNAEKRRQTLSGWQGR
jgi:hypothetical protein